MNADHIESEWKESKYFADVSGRIHHDSTIQTNLIRGEKNCLHHTLKSNNHLTQFKVRPQIFEQFVEQKSHKLLLWIHFAVS